MSEGSRRFYITTPIYYVNDIPHIGHAYTTIAADILARYHRLKGWEVFFLTGTDEHGQKVEKAAREKGRTPKEHADIMVENFKNLWKRLNVSNNSFIRTTDPEHKRVVQEILQRLWDKGGIEKRVYSGWYCTPDERFWTEKELINNNCPECGRPVEYIQEENYFFKMSKYQERLIRYIEEHPSYILPEARRNEVTGFLKNNTLGDLCISRPKARLSWGIPLPFDEDFVTYVWFDALLNYYSATKYLAPQPGNSDWWPADHHLVGKDILTTHAIYWSTMLMALDLPLPGNIYAHGWWTVEGKKMSKSLGNVVDPGEMVEKYGVDAFRYFLFREVSFGLDGDFSEQALIHRINTDLANDLGNLLSRTLTMIEKYRVGEVPVPVSDKDRELERRIHEGFKALPNSIDGFLKRLEFHHALIELWKVIAGINEYIAASEPWKEKNDERLSNILYTLAESLRIIAVYLYPFMPATAENIWKQLGVETGLTGLNLKDSVKWGWLKPGIKVRKADQLFPRIDLKKRDKEKKRPESVKSTANMVTLDDFARIELKIGRILEAERIKGSDKLLRLQVDTGEMRQIVAGIGRDYSPDELIGRKIAVVTNLRPVKLMGVESQGMLLAATDGDGRLSVLIPERDVKEGSKIR